MRPASLEQIKALLEILRANRALEEVRPLHFEVKGEELPVSSPTEHAELLAQIEDCLETVDSRARDRARQRERKRRGSRGASR